LYNQDINDIGHILRSQLALETQIHATRLNCYERDILKEERYSDPKKLNHYEQRVFSQFGEDGIIAEIFRRIGPQSKTFLEIGVADGSENNSAFLLLQGWSGYWIEGDEAHVDRIHRNFKSPLSRGDLKVVQSFVTAENIKSTLQNLDVPDDIDLLSLDIDRNTYQLWVALSHLKSRVIVVEYNAGIPADVNWKVDYHADRWWNGTSYYGASLKAYEGLGRSLGYSLVGCNLVLELRSIFALGEVALRTPSVSEWAKTTACRLRPGFALPQHTTRFEH